MIDYIKSKIIKKLSNEREIQVPSHRMSILYCLKLLSL